MLNIVCVDDQQEVLDSIVRDLRPLSDILRLEEASDEADCLSLMEQIHESGDPVAIVLTDRVMPNGSGLELLSVLATDPRFSATRRVVLSGLPHDEESMQAMEQGLIHAYLEKPWQREDLLNTLNTQLKLFEAQA